MGVEQRVLVLCVFAVCWFVTLSIPIDNFFSFGPDVDSLIGPNDDGSSDAVTGIEFPFYDDIYSSLFVNNNGIISLNQSFHQFDPRMFPLEHQRSLIAPYWADADTRRNGTVWYGLRNGSSDQMYKAKQNVMKYFCLEDYKPLFLFIATWDQVPHFNEGLKTNTFQCVLISDGIQSFAIFLYADGLMEWTTGDASDGTDGLGGNAAHVGYDAGDRESFENVPGSGNASIINITRTSNVGVNGVWAFQFNEAFSWCGKGTWFQLKLQLHGLCSSWLIESYHEKISDIENEILDQLTSRDYDILDGIISNGTLICFPSSPLYVTYRAYIQGNMATPTMTLITYITEWLKSDPKLKVNGELLLAHSKCRVAISSYNEPECDSSKSTIAPSRKVLIIAITVLVFALLTLLLIVSVIVILKLKHKRKISSLNTSKSEAYLSTYDTKEIFEISDSTDDHFYEPVIILNSKKTEVKNEEFTFTHCRAYAVPNKTISKQKNFY